MIREDSLIWALASGTGGAIAVLRVSGENTKSCLQQIFRTTRGRPLKNFRPRHMHYGQVQDSAGKILDEVCLAYFPNGQSYTGESMAEIYCHGSGAVIRSIGKLLESLGVRPALPGEFTRRAFLNGRMGLSQAEAIRELIEADTELEASLAIHRLKGALKGKVQSLRAELIDTAAHLEATLDYPEEDIEFMDDSALLKRLGGLKNQIQEMIEAYGRQYLIRQGIKTVIVGKPNAGKSSLLNALLKEDRAIVTEIAGTTRDSIEEELILKGVRFRFMDTAGIREAQDKAEALGIARSLKAEEEADLLIYLVDATTVLEEKPGRKPDLLVLNKIDLGVHESWQNLIETKEARTISALTHEGLSDLLDSLVGMARDRIGDVSPDTVGISSERQAHCLEMAMESLHAFENSLNSGIPMDIALVDLYEARDHLGQITGEIASEDIIDRIFEKFCIGK